MRLTLRSHIAAALVVVLTLTGQSMATLRGASAATGQIVICTGTGPVSLLVDREGQPTGPAHICPDCMASALTGVLAAALVLDDCPPCADGVDHIAQIAWDGGATEGAEARGPPVLA